MFRCHGRHPGGYRDILLSRFYRTPPLFLRLFSQKINYLESCPANPHSAFIWVTSATCAQNRALDDKKAPKLRTPPLFIRLFRRDASESTCDAERPQNFVHRLYSFDFQVRRPANPRNHEISYTAFIPDGKLRCETAPPKISYTAFIHSTSATSRRYVCLRQTSPRTPKSRANCPQNYVHRLYSLDFSVETPANPHTTRNGSEKLYTAFIHWTSRCGDQEIRKFVHCLYS